MDSSNLISKAFLISQTAVLLTVGLANPAVSQDSGFLGYNQSRIFFDQGRQQFEQEIKLFEVNIEPIKIKQSQDLEESQDLKQSNSQPKSDLKLDNEQLEL